MTAASSTANKHQQQQPLQHRRPAVQFSKEPPHEVSFDDEKGMTDTERKAFRAALWYSRQEYEAFLRDRIETIRVWRSVRGDFSSTGLQQFYCVRGLEAYTTPTTADDVSSSGSIQRHRTIYQQAVFKEQAKQVQQYLQQAESRCSSNRANHSRLILDLEKIAQVVRPMSEWALQRAQKLALLDEKEALEVKQNDLIPTPSLKRKKRSDDYEMSSPPPSSSTCAASSSCNPRRLAKRRHSTFVTKPFFHVDVNKLKEWNVRLLQQMAYKQQLSCTDVIRRHSLPSSTMMMMTTGGRDDHNNNNNNASTNSTTSAPPLTQDQWQRRRRTTREILQEATALHCATEAELAMTPSAAAATATVAPLIHHHHDYYALQYSPVRRDSLYGVEHKL